MGIARAFIRNIKHFRLKEGGSTITQQVIKNYFLNPKKTFSRKFKEIIMAVLMENLLTKDQILDLYLNLIYMGQKNVFQVHGFETASQHYFHKSANKLSLSECALLASLIRSPGFYNPFKNKERAILRRNHLLKKMLEAHLIDNDEYQKAQNKPLPKKQQSLATFPSPYFVEAVQNEIKTKNIKIRPGSKVYTTLKPHFQKTALDSIQKQLNYLQKKTQHTKHFTSSSSSHTHTYGTNFCYYRR